MSNADDCPKSPPRSVQNMIEHCDDVLVDEGVGVRRKIKGQTKTGRATMASAMRGILVEIRAEQTERGYAKARARG